MGDEVAVEAPADAETVKPAEDAKPTPPRGPVKRYAKPNVDELKGKVNALEETISKAKLRQDEIRKELDGRRRGGNDTESNDIRKHLQALRNEFQQVLGQKKATREELDHATKARDALRTQVRGMKTKMEYTTVEKIDEQMQRLETKLQHTSVSIQEEKKILDDIKKLRQSRASVASFSSKLEQLDGDDDCKTIVERLREQDAKLTDIRSQEDALRTQLSEIRAKDDAKNLDIPQLTQELGDAKVLVRESVATIHQLRTEHRAKHDQWWEGEQAWREQRQRDRERRDEEYAAIRAERDAERKQRAQELAGEPFNKEVTLCEQLQGYLTKHQDAAKSAEGSMGDKAAVAPLDGMAIYTRKKVEDENPYASLEKKSKKGRKQDKFKAAADSSDKKINHSFDILEAFSKLSVEAPLTVSKVPAAQDSVKERLAHYLKRREEVKTEGGDAEEPPANDAASAGSPSGAAPGSKAPKAEPKPFELGEPEPTPAEAASGRAPAPTPGAAAAPSGGAWNTGAAAAPAPEAATGAEPAAEGNGGDDAAAAEFSEGVSVGLTEEEGGNVKVELTVGR